MDSLGWLGLLPGFLRRRLEGRPQVLTIVHNSGWLMFDKLVRMALAVTVGAWVARYLGPARFGELAYVIAFIAFFQAVANLGLDGIIVRDLAQGEGRAEIILGSALWLRVGVGCIAWACALLAMLLLRAGDHQALVLTALVGGTLIFQAADTIDLWFQSQAQNRRTTLAKLVGYLLSNAIKVWLIVRHAPIVAFGAVMAFEFMLIAVGLAVAYRRFPTSSRWKASGAVARRLVGQSWPFMLSGVAVITYMRIDQIMIREMLGGRELGIYSAVLPISQLWHVIPMTLFSSLAPFVARKRLEGKEGYYQVLQKAFRLFGWIAVLCSIAVAVLAAPIVGLLYGSAFADAVNVLRIHVFTNVFIALGVAQGFWMLNENAGRVGLLKAILGGVVSVAGNFLLLPILGIYGAACVAVLAQFVSAVGSNALLAPRIWKMQLSAFSPR